MRWFSERHGYRSVRDSQQIEKIDRDTRNRLWNIISREYLSSAKGHSYKNYDPECKELMRYLWHDYFHWTFDDLNEREGNNAYSLVRKYVCLERWYVTYDIIEVILEFVGAGTRSERFIENVNQVLVEDTCGYRIISRLVVPITSEIEITEIEEAISYPFLTTNQHLHIAIELFSDRTNPNYPNSVKEAISAVESMSRIILADRNVTLGAALRGLEERGVAIHGAFRTGISALYGWTSVDGGIRHARVDDSEIGFDEAKMMIVLCSAFVNFLKTKAEEAGIDLVANYTEIRDS